MKPFYKPTKRFEFFREHDAIKLSVPVPLETDPAVCITYTLPREIARRLYLELGDALDRQLIPPRSNHGK